jgi:DNA-binding PadR family transcriptional regulator
VNEEDAPRKYYYLTGAGNTVLKEMNDYWKNLNSSIISLIEE